MLWDPPNPPAWHTAEAPAAPVLPGKLLVAGSGTFTGGAGRAAGSTASPDPSEGPPYPQGDRYHLPAFLRVHSIPSPSSSRKVLNKTDPRCPSPSPWQGSKAFTPALRAPMCPSGGGDKGLIHARPSWHPSHFPPVMKPPRFQRFRSIQRKFGIDLSFVKGF